MRLLAISDLHVGRPENRDALERLSDHGDDWLIIAGDVGETEEHLAFALDTLGDRFGRLLWVPGNHELWTVPRHGAAGVEKYERLIDVCRTRGVATPEDPFLTWSGEGGTHCIALCFVLYDYSFRPDDVPLERAVDWACEADVLSVDEHLLRPAPYSTIPDWCAERVRITEARLAAATSAAVPLVLVNHFPLREEHAVVPRLPRFSLWCGSTATADWHRRFDVRVVVSGHLHIRSTRWLDGCRFEEVSLGYPGQWRRDLGIQPYLREIFPEPDSAGRRAPVAGRSQH